MHQIAPASRWLAQELGNCDPEEAFIAALSSCHMLFFLDFARHRDVVRRADPALGVHVVHVVTAAP
jgi:organic hydroperoxide reductase OsmC/OhrA